MLCNSNNVSWGGAGRCCAILIMLVVVVLVDVVQLVVGMLVRVYVGHVELFTV